ncbi:hypothetical protein Mic7113_3202 [Allocoleopsis franciscana PCC 7113]|uniref:SPOR domain-containing protein n=2 Tax=Allocoleopsis TaxID=2886347 RepID=K9WGK0_9CYAN|nr:hypothetical protein Mic7113_3202 [Allocoleopsis franciscana PCC 7113]
MRVRNIAFLRVSSGLLTLVSLSGFFNLAQAQPSMSPCQPPQSNEYLLLVRTSTQESQEQLQRTLPANTQFTVCRYLEDTVTRVSGFKRVEDANDWARYVKEIVGLSAYVLRPSATTVSTNIPSYNPQPLGEGYAVLVDYFNQPEVAGKLKQLLGSDVGLVSYGTRPYLLVVYTNDQSKANSTLRRLSDRGFLSMVVDSRRVTLLRPVVNF